MPLKSPLLKFSLNLSVAVIAFTFISYFGRAQNPKTPLYQKIVKTKKLQPPVTVKINMLEDADVEAHKSYRLEGVIHTVKSFANAHYEWNAPQEVSLSGRTRGDDLVINEGEELKLALQFSQSDNVNRKIQLVVKDPLTGHVIGQAAYNTTRQRAIAQENKELLERQEAYLEENPDVIKEIKGEHSH